MQFEIIQKQGRSIVSQQIVADRQAADAIENWSSRFTDKPRTRYGMKITMAYLEGLAVDETGRFVQPLTGQQREELAVRRVA